MINIKIAANKGKYFIDCFGHAGYGEKGKDIVCAGVSSLCMALNAVIQRIPPEKCSRHIIKVGDGAYTADIHCEKDSPTDEALKSCLYMFYMGISLLSRNYPHCIKVESGLYPDEGLYTDTSEKTMTKKERKGGLRRRISLQIFAEASEGGDALGEANATSEKADTEEAFSPEVAEKEFEELIKGKYSDAFKKRTKSIIDKRFSKMKTYERTAELVAPLLESISQGFPEIDKADTEGLIRAYFEREEKQSAEKKRSLEKEARMQLIDSHLKKRAATELSKKLSEEALKLREIYPSFDLKGEYASSPEFRVLLGAGLSLRRAYEAVNLEKIMGSVLRYAVLKTGKNTADAIMSPGRVAENSLLDRASSVKRTDVKNLTEKEIMDILSQVSRGAKIIF